MAENRVSILSEGGKVSDVVIVHRTWLTQLRHRFVVFIHEGWVRVVHEVNELWESGVQLRLLLDNLVVEFDSVGVEDRVADLVPYALLLQVCDERVLDLVPVCRENAFSWMPNEGKLEIVPATNSIAKIKSHTNFKLKARVIFYKPGASVLEM